MSRARRFARDRNEDEAIRTMERWWCQQDTVNQAEDRRRRSDPERKRDDRDRRKPGMLRRTRTA
jgi:hypothetical protein